MKKTGLLWILLVLCLCVCGCTPGEELRGAWQAEGEGGEVYEFAPDGGFSARVPGDAGNIVFGRYTCTDGGKISIAIRDDPQEYAGNYRVSHGVLMLTMAGEVRYFTRYRP